MSAKPVAPSDDSRKEIFVFGADLGGRHSSGDALTALRDHGAVYGRAVGLQGRSYAIPVRDETGKLLPLPVIAGYVQAFLRFAATYPQMRFRVTRLAAGRGGYRDEEMAPLFAGAPANCRLPPAWQRHLSAGKGRRG